LVPVEFKSRGPMLNLPFCTSQIVDLGQPGPKTPEQNAAKDRLF
jgi:hypothetical protein